MGSGSNRIAAYDLEIDFYACELEKQYFKDQEDRFATHIKQQKIFTPQQLQPEQLSIL